MRPGPTPSAWSSRTWATRTPTTSRSVDVAPAGLTFISEDSANCAIVAGDLGCSFAHLGPNSSTTITVTYDVPATTDAGTITNTAHRHSDEDTDTDSDTRRRGRGRRSRDHQDLRRRRGHRRCGRDPHLQPGGRATWATRTPTTSRSVDVAPAGLTFISEDSANCAIVAGDLVCSFAHLGPNSSTTITVTYDVPATTNAGTITNTATVTSDEDTDTDSDTRRRGRGRRSRDHQDVHRRQRSPPVRPGPTPSAWSSSNLGDSDADNVTIVDVAPAGLTFISEDSANCAIVAGDLSCSFAHLGPNSSTTITVTYDVPATTNAGTITNTAHRRLRRGHRHRQRHASSWSRTSISRSPRPSPTTASPPARPGPTPSAWSSTTWATRTPTTSRSVDVAPAGLTFISEDSANCAIVAGDLSCSFAHLGPNSSTTITVTYDVPATTNAGTITNSATVDSDEDLDTDSDTRRRGRGRRSRDHQDVHRRQRHRRRGRDPHLQPGRPATWATRTPTTSRSVDVAPAGLTFISEDSANCAHRGRRPGAARSPTSGRTARPRSP